MQRRILHINNSLYSQKREIDKTSNGFKNDKQGNTPKNYQMHNIDCLMDNIAQARLGHEITEKGRKPIVSKTLAILNLKPPTTHKTLKSSLGSVHHLTKFIPNLATLCRGFRDLIRKDKNTYGQKITNQISKQ